ncbi:MAG: PspA/IM30 family protein [Gammaproteobacteria bacterium]
MQIFTRISTSLSAAIERAVGAMENHDAVVEASTREVRRAAGEARARLKRVRNEAHRMEQKIETLTEAQATWARRAVGDGVDEATALECLRRRRDAERQVASLQSALAQQQEIDERLGANIERLEQRLGELQRQRSVMRSREAAAEALRATEAASATGVFTDVDDTLERWEARIAEAEMGLDLSDPADALERRFLAEEERASLRAELDRLKRGTED